MTGLDLRHHGGTSRAFAAALAGILSGTAPSHPASDTTPEEIR